MKKIFSLIILASIFGHLRAEVVIVVNSRKLDGDGSGKYKFASKNTTTHNETASPWIQIDIFCEGSGDKDCPKAFEAPLTPEPDPAFKQLGRATQSICFEIYEEIMALADNGKTGGTVIRRASESGSEVVHLITVHWQKEADGNVKMIFAIREDTTTQTAP